MSQDQLVAEIKNIYAGLVMVESKCIEVDKAQSAKSCLNKTQLQGLIALHRALLHEDNEPFNSSSATSQDDELGAFCPKFLYDHGVLAASTVDYYHFCLLQKTILPALLVLWGVCWMFIIGGPGDLDPEKLNVPVSTFSPAPAAYDFLENSGPAYYELGLQSVLMPEPSTTGFDQHPTIDGLPFDDVGASIDPIYLVQAAPQDPYFLSFDALPRNSAGITEMSAKEDLTGVLPAAITPDPILQTYGDANNREPFNPMVNVASVGQGVQNTGGQKSTSYLHVRNASRHLQHPLLSTDIRQKRTRIQHPALKSRFHARTEAARGPREGLPSNVFTT
ncbi:hypothetical protein FACUT_6828 [Fusarium acutatum]|uniref:Uncharacterized protein n=1 Tax=Fusarium acutatum TaxID=78861 RepID=A0A8H4JRY3_9HYPO|nr:hypothetical protein FACUT_6828 [Fusarium acutatum]